MSDFHSLPDTEVLHCSQSRRMSSIERGEQPLAADAETRENLSRGAKLGDILRIS